MLKVTFGLFGVLSSSFFFRPCLATTAAATPAAVATAPASTPTQVRREIPPARLVWDAVNSTCGEKQAESLRRAVAQAGSIAEGLQRSGINASASSFIEHFGTGWDTGNLSHVPALVLENLRIARTILEARPDSGAPKLVDLTCADEDRYCSMTVPAYTALRNTTGRQAIVLCPLFFLQQSVIKYLPQCRLSAVQGSSFYKDTIVLHEVMHLDGVGYRTAFSDGRRDGPEAVLKNPNHITDIKVQMPGTDGVMQLYGRENCMRYAASVTPPLLATANADSYVWLALEQWFQFSFMSRWRGPLDRDIWGRRANEPRPSFPLNGMGGSVWLTSTLPVPKSIATMRMQC